MATFLKPCIFALLIIAIGANDTGYGNRPRGVPLSKAGLYSDSLEFECFDGSKKIPFEQVNDDYCDCADGSDEPGTSACSNGVFHCINKGYKALDVPSSRVNDLICDCCDGSDEWDSEVTCPNTCNEFGAESRRAAEEFKKISAAGFATRKQLSEEGQKLVAEKTGGVIELKKQLDELTPLKTAAEAKKTEAEEKEREAKAAEDSAWETARAEKRKVKAEELFKALDGDNDSKVTPADLKLLPGLDAITDDEAKAVFNGAEEVTSEEFLDKLFDNIRRKVRESRKDPEPIPAESDPEAEVDHEEDEDHESESEADTESHDESATPDEDEFDHRPPYSAETQALIDASATARSEFEAVLSQYSEVEVKIRDAENFAEFDYGTDHAWAPLKGQCFEFNEGKYIYKFCPFDKTTQKDSSGYSEVTLGYWKGWAGPEANKYAAQQYDRGQSCWNGPERSTFVAIKCGAETKVTAVVEPAKCEYQFNVETPVACRDPKEINVDNYHEEL
uniref:Glucosidase 2 subunit beta n=1 Tax=Panagrellus redivivus TaxID=6233 RepID=A0A7E4WDT6_PANRE